MSAALVLLAHLERLRRLRAVALALIVPLTACGDYDPKPRAAAGSGAQPATMGALTPAETAAGGAGGNSGQAAQDGSGPAGGSSAAGGTASSSGGGGGGLGGSGTIEVEPVEASCDAVTSCGGDVVGTWVVAGSCLPVSGMANVSGFGLGCTAAPVTGLLEVTGTWTARADGTFTDQTITSGDSQLELPPECLNVSGTITTCDRLGGAFQALGYASVLCTDAASGGGCTCLASAEQAGGLAIVALGAPSSGTYATANGVLTTSAGVDTEYAYCVSGNTLIMTPQTTGATGALTGTMAFVKP